MCAMSTIIPLKRIKGICLIHQCTQTTELLLQLYDYYCIFNTYKTHLYNSIII